MIADALTVPDIADGAALTPPQAEILALKLLDGPAVISMPTGGGKTWLALRRARAVLDADARARVVFLVPQRHQEDDWRGLDGYTQQAYRGYVCAPRCFKSAATAS